MTIKTKNKILIIGFLVILIVCYQLAISKTLSAKKEYNTLIQESLLFKDTPKQVSLLKQKQDFYDGILTKYQLNGSSIQNNLLKTINTFTVQNNLKVASFLEPHVIYKNDMKINTYQFTLEGDYNPIIKLIHSLEQDTKFGEIINLHFEKKTNFRTGNNYLQANVLLKNLN